jgi:Leucine-rich repeat (LRR) protein
MPDESLPLVPLAGSQLARHGSGGGRILDDMVSSTLTTSQKEGALISRCRIGDIDFCEPDYWQMLLWAKNMRMTPEAVLLSLWNEKGTLFESLGPSFGAFNRTQIKAGKLHRVFWDFNKLSLKFYEWIQGLEIQAMEFVGESPSHILELPLPTLLSLDVSFCSLEQLRLRSVPALEEVTCCGNSLRELDLSKVPRLKKLECSQNELIALDLSSLKELEELDCGYNKMFALDLTQVSKLRKLQCHNNQITCIDLKSMPGLQVLACSGNPLGNLDLSSVTSLEYLYCEEDELTELQIEAVPELRELWCSNNRLTKLDLTATPMLETLICQGNMLEELDIRPLEHLEALSYDCGRTRLIQRPDQDF